MLWRVKEDYSDKRSLFSPNDIALTTRGQVAVVDVIQHRVQFFDTKGAFTGDVNLDKAWGRKPRYPNEISADRDGGVLIYDFHGSPPIVRMNADGKVLAQFQLKHSDGRMLDPTCGVKVSPSGQLWACDGSSLVQLNDQGVANRVLGPPPSNEHLGEVAAVAVDQAGHLSAVDERTGAVHVFDATGKRLKVCSPKVGDFSEKLSMAHLGVTDNGEVFLGSGDGSGYLHFDPDGKRLGVKQLRLDEIQEKWYPLPMEGRLLVLGYHEAFIVDNQDKVLQKIQRRPDRNWLEHPQQASVAPDGSFAIVSGEGFSTDRPWFVSLYSPEGEPVRTVPMPAACNKYVFAFTGKYLVSCTKTEICLFSASGEPILTFPYPPEQQEEPWWTCFGTQGGRELWLVSAQLKKVHRFQLP